MTRGPFIGDDAALQELLQAVGVRPTTQRIALCRLLFGGAHRHVTVPELHLEAANAGTMVSMATVYNTLNQLRDAGLLGEVVIDGGGSYFDTNVDPHCHVYNVDTRELTDVQVDTSTLSPPLKPGQELVGVDLTFRVRG